MSSHHIVRDEQEPALLIKEPNSAGSNTIGNLLEWSPTVIVLEPAIQNVLSWGIKIDMVICSNDSLEKYKQLLLEQVPVKLLAYNQGEQPMSNAFYFLRSSKYPAVNLLANFNEELVNFLADFTEDLEIVVICEKFRWYYIKDNTFRKWVTEGQGFKIPKSTQLDGMVFQGFENNSIEQDTIFYAKDDGYIEIHSSHPFWLGEQYN